MVIITSGVGGNTSTPSFILSANEPVVFECRVDDGEFVPSLTPFTTPSLPDGDYVLEVRATDAAGNVGTATHQFTIDTAPATLTSIDVTPINPDVAIGLTQQFSAAGLFSDGSSQDLTSSVTWASSHPAIATISSTGLAGTLAAGTSLISASRDGVLGTTSLTVLSVDDQLAILRARVIAFRSECVLTRGQAHSLLARLNLKGNDRDVHKVEAFLKKVHSQARAGIFTQVQADSLLGPGSILLLTVQRRS